MDRRVDDEHAALPGLQLLELLGKGCRGGRDGHAAVDLGANVAKCVREVGNDAGGGVVDVLVDDGDPPPLPGADDGGDSAHLRVLAGRHADEEGPALGSGGGARPREHEDRHTGSLADLGDERRFFPCS